MNVVTMKMSNGDEVVANVTNEEENYVVVDRPMLIQQITSPQGMQLVMVPWMHSATVGETLISKHFVVSNKPTDKSWTDGYLQQTSGIALS